VIDPDDLRRVLMSTRAKVVFIDWGKGSPLLEAYLEQVPKSGEYIQHEDKAYKIISITHVISETEHVVNIVVDRASNSPRPFKIHG
jgi:hypothetical protein